MNTVEKKKIRKLIEELPENRIQIGKRILKELFFMFDTLDDLKEVVIKEGVIVDFINGSQIMKRQNPALKTYNELMPKFNKLLKDFIELLPVPVKENEKDELMEFLKSGI